MDSRFRTRNSYRLKQSTMKEKTYTFTTYNRLGEEINQYYFKDTNIKYAHQYAKKILANSRDNEVSNSRIKVISLNEK